VREFTIRSVGLLAALLLMDGAAIAQTASASSCNGFHCYEHPPVCGNLFWVSVLSGSGMTTAEDLLEFTPLATRVTKRYPAPRGCPEYTWDGTTCTSAAPGCTTVPEPGASACGSSCFCANEGAGFEFTVSQPIRINLNGWDRDFTHQLQAANGYLVTLPIYTPLNNASDLLAALPGGVGSVSQLVCGQVETFTGVAGPDFALIRGQAYSVSSATSGTLTLTTQGGSPVPCPGNGYRVSGSSTGVGYAWGVDADSSGACCDLSNDLAPGVMPPGSPSADLVRSLVDEINSTGGCLGSGLTCNDNGDCVSGTCLMPGNEILAQIDTSVSDDEFCLVSRLSAPELYVDTAPGPASCNVTTRGPCSFNPDAELAPIPIPYVILPQSDRMAWKPVANAYDVVLGELGSLRASAGDYSVSTLRCLENDRTLAFVELPDDPANGAGFFYLVRALNDFDTTGYNFQRFGGQVGDRDVGIGASGRDCPQ